MFTVNCHIFHIERRHEAKIFTDEGRNYILDINIKYYDKYQCVTVRYSEIIV